MFFCLSTVCRGQSPLDPKVTHFNRQIILFDVFAFIFIVTSCLICAYNALKTTLIANRILRIKLGNDLRRYIVCSTQLCCFCLWGNRAVNTSDDGIHSSFYSVWKVVSCKAFSLALALTLMTFAPSDGCQVGWKWQPSSPRQPVNLLSSSFRCWKLLKLQGQVNPNPPPTPSWGSRDSKRNEGNEL